MKLFLEIVSVILYFEFVCPVQMNYVYNDNPNLVYIAAVPNIGYHSKTKFNGPRKYYVGNTNQKYMKLVNEEAINSLFSVKKNSPKVNQPDSDKNKVNEERNLEYDKQWQVKKLNKNRVMNNPNVQDKLDEFKPTILKDPFKSPELKTNPANQKTTVSQERKHYDFYGIQDKFNKANIKMVAKTQVDQSKVSKSIAQRPIPETNNKTKVGGKDEFPHKLNKEHREHTMSKLFSDMTQKTFERYQRKQEFRKRETNNKKARKFNENLDKSQVNTKSGLKFHKDHNVKFLDNNRHIPARIGKNDENDKPYALFYRSHESYDQRDFYTGVVDQSSLDNTINGEIDVEINIRDKVDTKNDNKTNKQMTNVKRKHSRYDHS